MLTPATQPSLVQCIRRKAFQQENWEWNSVARTKNKQPKCLPAHATIAEACPESLEELGNRTLCPWVPLGHVVFIFLSRKTFFSGVLQAPDPSPDYCQLFPGQRGRRTLQKRQAGGDDFKVFWWIVFLEEGVASTHTHTHRVTCFVPCITISLRSGWWEDHKAHQNSSRAVPLCLQSHRIPESARLENTSKTESKLCPIPSLPEQRAGHLQGWALHSCPNI